jgi:hypothetical protein
MQGFVGIRELGGIQAVLRSMVFAIGNSSVKSTLRPVDEGALRRDPGSWGLAFAGHFTR